MKDNNQRFPITKCQKVILPQGAIYLGPSDKRQSVGYLELNPYSSLNLHNRPAIEQLTQIEGKSSMIIFKENEQCEVVNMKEGDYLEIRPKNTWHIHANSTNTISLQYWDFAGDITDIIKHIRENSEK